jgi:URI fold toxin 2
MEHGNSKKNEKEHHLYEIIDKYESDTFKFGISDKPIEEDGLSNRVREQVHFLNLAVGWIRYVGKIIIFGIKNRLLAKELENKYIDDYNDLNGKLPRGNPPRRTSKFEEE